jgi:hypothetical protein
MHGGRLGLDLAAGAFRLALAEDRESESGDPEPADRLRIGGLPSTVLPPIATATRILEPGLPAGALAGTTHEGQRVELALPGLPLVPFWSRHRVENDGTWSDWLALAGLDWELALPPLSIVRLPGARLQIGAAYGLDAPDHGDVRGWVAVTWRP